MDEVTIIIKTFNRKKRLLKLVDSIFNYYPNINVIIVDDSRKSSMDSIIKKYNNIKYINTEYDIGLSKGRNILVENVKTKYFLLCDDDFVFDNRTNLMLAKKILLKSKADILGGMVYNRISFNCLFSILWSLKKPSRIIDIIRKKEFISIYNGQLSDNKNRAILKIDKDINNYADKEYSHTDICSNFFIAKTKKIKKMGGWIPETLKVGEHEIFFLRAKREGVNVAFTTRFGVVHYPQKKLGYLRYRERAGKLFKDACSQLGLSSYIVKDKKDGTIYYKYE